MKTVIFGTGNFYKRKIDDLKRLEPEMELIAFLDNDVQKTEVDGIQVYRPDRIKDLSYDQIILMSLNNSSQMRDQLIGLGVPAGAVYDYWQFASRHSIKRLQLYIGNEQQTSKKRIMILTEQLGYDGAPIAATYAASVLQEKGYQVILVSEQGNLAFINEMKEKGFNIVLYPGMSSLGTEERYFINQFDLVIVNVFPMVRFAVAISKIRPTLWWIHEAPQFIDKTIRKNPDITKPEYLEELNVYAVSSVAKNSFNAFFPGATVRELPYGIPEYNTMANKEEKIDGKITFAIIGSLCEIKAQDIFLQAIKTMGVEDDVAEYLLIGPIGSGEYQTNARKMAEEITGVKLTGTFSRQEIGNIFENIDVLVCPSRVDCLPIVCTEAMMFGKPFIVSDNTGTAAFVKDGWNGFVCKTEDVEDLASKMKWFIENRAKLPEMGRNARETYEEFFSMESFGERLEKALMETADAFAGE